MDYENTRNWFVNNVDFRSRTLYCGYSPDLEDSTITDPMGTTFIKGIILLDKDKGPIDIVGYGPGGEWSIGLAMYDAIKNCSNEVTCTFYGECFSMSTIILQACDERILSPNCRFLIHEGVDGVPEDTVRNALAKSNEIKYNLDLMYSIYLDRIKEKKPKYTKSKLEEKIKSDMYLNAKEVVDLGLADRILGE